MRHILTSGSIVNMFRIVSFCIGVLMLPLCVLAYTSVIAKPENAKVVLPILQSQTPQEFFGRLDGFPHTFEFEVQQSHPFKAQIFVPDIAVQKNDISIIIIKEERRGVSEVGRTLVKNESWSQSHDRLLVETFKNGGKLESQLEPGVYRLEVSSPNNNGKYRLVLGTEKISRGYLEHLKVLFEVKSFLDNSKFTTLLSPLIYIPLGILLLCVGVYMYRRRKKKLLTS